ncbi:MAG: hypothetical protein IT321_23670 [Anaerolineae bacterium]|nr:hypothetical protein [Anaerolineae bacterium]
METNFISNIIRRSNRNQLILWGIGLVVMLVIIAISLNHFYNLLTGPYVVDKDYILGITDVNNLRQFYVTLKGDETLDTGFYKTSTTNGIETGKDYYKTLILDDKLLLVKTGDVDNLDAYTGALTYVPPDEQREVLDQLQREIPNLDDSFLPFMLDATDFKGSGYAGLAATVVAFAACLWGVLRALGRIVNTERHSIWRGLQRFGEPSSVADQIETELGSSGEKVGNIQITRNWLVANKASSLDVTQLKDVMWIYKKIVNGRGGKQVSALVYDRHGHLMTVTGKEAQIDDTLRGIAQRMPWIMVGYSKEIEAAWKKDRAGVINAVDQRRKQANQ